MKIIRASELKIFKLAIGTVEYNRRCAPYETCIVVNDIGPTLVIHYNKERYLEACVRTLLSFDSMNPQLNSPKEKIFIVYWSKK